MGEREHVRGSGCKVESVYVIESSRSKARRKKKKEMEG
jgi:hypothetical protein